MTDPQLARWFTSGALLTASPTSGTSGRCLVVEDADEHATGRVLDLAGGRVGPVLPFAVGFGSLLSPDGTWAELARTLLAQVTTALETPSTTVPPTSTTTKKPSSGRPSAGK